ncbi:MAG: hypothetical protein SFV15_16885 [Polyangiaceae bacterium]|nr:hypothetical protein [Polyangiaceae bacterium]
MKISRQDLLKVGFVSAAAGLVGVACSDDESSPGGGGGGAGNTTGGKPGTGGAASGTGGKATGGAASGTGGKATGGASNSGGASNANTGGKATGGTSNTGGANNNNTGGADDETGGTNSGTGGGSSGDGGKCSAEPTAMTVTGHEHPITVPLADVIAGTAKTYTLELGGEPEHTHTLMVTPADFTTLKTTGTVTLTSSNDGHSHDVTITCGDAE